MCGGISICVEALVYTWRHQYIHGDIHVLSLEAETESSEVLLLQVEDKPREMIRILEF